MVMLIRGAGWRLTTEPLPGRYGEATVDPAFGLNAIWIESALKEQAQIQGYTVVEASTVVATHLNHLISQHAAELFGRQEAQQLLDRVAQEMPKLTEDLVPRRRHAHHTA